jgi:hypothetical protein
LTIFLGILFMSFCPSFLNRYLSLSWHHPFLSTYYKSHILSIAFSVHVDICLLLVVFLCIQRDLCPCLVFILTAHKRSLSLPFLYPFCPQKTSFLAMSLPFLPTKDFFHCQVFSFSADKRSLALPYLNPC